MEYTICLVLLLIHSIASINTTLLPKNTIHTNINISLRGVEIPRYQVHLDAPKDQMWTEIISDYKEHLSMVSISMRDLIASQVGNGLTAFLAKIVKGINSFTYYSAEIKAIAKQSGIELGLLTAIQLMYEASAHCTSIICNDEHGHPIHIRTMDWAMDFLKTLTIEIEFMRDNKTVCIVTSWAGYVGVLTGMRIGKEGFSVAVNYRESDDGSTYWTNLFKALQGSWPIGFLLREVLTDPDIVGFNAAKNILQQTKLIAPVYFTLSGCNKGEGVLITRDRDSDLKPLYLKHGSQNVTAKEFRPFLIQTNKDHWSNLSTGSNIMYSTERTQLATTEMKRIYKSKEEKVSYNTLWTLISKHPILQQITVYGTLMNCFDGYYETRIPNENTIGHNKRKKGFYRRVGFKEKPDSKWKECVKCNKQFHDAFNVKGHCVHTGKWHSNYADCGIGCLRVGRNIGYSHWSCCYSIEFNSTCKYSTIHADFI